MHCTVKNSNPVHFCRLSSLKSIDSAPSPFSNFKFWKLFTTHEMGLSCLSLFFFKPDTQIWTEQNKKAYWFLQVIFGHSAKQLIQASNTTQIADKLKFFVGQSCTSLKNRRWTHCTDNLWLGILSVVQGSKWGFNSKLLKFLE